jgi:hypothetical protein
VRICDETGNETKPLRGGRHLEYNLSVFLGESAVPGPPRPALRTPWHVRRVRP